MSKIPTAKELLKDKTQFGTYGNMYKREDVSKKMIEFAKLHVEAALKEASEKAVTDYEYAGETGEFDDISVYDYFVDKNSILNAYPLENVK